MRYHHPDLRRPRPPGRFRVATEPLEIQFRLQLWQEVPLQLHQAVLFLKSAKIGLTWRITLWSSKRSMPRPQNGSWQPQDRSLLLFNPQVRYRNLVVGPTSPYTRSRRRMHSDRRFIRDHAEYGFLRIAGGIQAATTHSGHSLQTVVPPRIDLTLTPMGTGLHAIGTPDPIAP